uniref:Uncharacterized protein n=1 Tax=Sciurus vulgaris TaxID=55149 RepID=A0A8D2ANR3_SCIVU
MEARELGNPAPNYHLLPEASRPKVEEDVSLPPQVSSEAMQLKKEISLLNGVLLSCLVSHYIAEGGLKLAILLPELPQSLGLQVC